MGILGDAWCGGEGNRMTVVYINIIVYMVTELLSVGVEVTESQWGASWLASMESASCSGRQG